jgi:sugar lactone lactonase YvrE
LEDIKYEGLCMSNNCLLYCIIISCSIFCSFSCNKVSNPDNSTISDITITSLRPTHGPYNTIDTVTGKGFDQIPVFDSVLLNGQKLTVISRSSEQVIVKIPSLAGTGNIDIWYKGKMVEGPVFTYDSILLVTTIAGSSTEWGEVNGKGPDARFNHPVGIAVDHSGNVYVAEAGGSAIRKIDTAGNVTTLAGPATSERGYADGTGSSAMFSSPLGLCIDQTGSLYVADQFNYRVRKVSPAGVVTTFAGTASNGSPSDGAIDGDGSIATFDTPFGVACDKNGNIYVADSYNNKIRKITKTGVVSSLAGGDYYHYGQQDGQGSSARFYSPTAVAVDSQGNVYTIDSEGELLRRIKPDGTVNTLLGPREPDITGPYDLFHSVALATDKNGNVFFSISAGIMEMSPDGKITRYATGGIGETDGPAQLATYRAIAGIAVDDAGTLYITDNDRVRKIGWQ